MSQELVAQVVEVLVPAASVGVGAFIQSLGTESAKSFLSVTKRIFAKLQKFLGPGTPTDVQMDFAVREALRTNEIDVSDLQDLMHAYACLQMEHRDILAKNYFEHPTFHAPVNFE